MSDATSATPASNSKRRLWAILKWCLFAVVAVCVVQRAVLLWDQPTVTIAVLQSNAEATYVLAWKSADGGRQRTGPLPTTADCGAIREALHEAGLRSTIVTPADDAAGCLVTGIPSLIEELRAVHPNSDAPFPEVRVETTTAGEHLAQLDVEPLWLLGAGLAYALGWLPSVWFWRRLMNTFGGDVSFGDAARAYYCGHLGKYVPGKATALLIRAGLLKERGCRAGLAALSATYETLAIMGAGLAVGIALAPLVFAKLLKSHLPGSLTWLTESTFVLPVVVALAGLAALPLVAKLLTTIARKATPREFDGNSDATPPDISARLLLTGALVFLLAWMLHGLSLGLTIRSLSPAGFDLAQWPLWTASTALATSAGFFVLFAPGGIGVREGLLIETLRIQPAIGVQIAVIAAILLRIVWFATEVVVSALLYWSGGAPPKATNSVRQG